MSHAARDEFAAIEISNLAQWDDFLRTDWSWLVNWLL